jgi:lysophospholipase
MGEWSWETKYLERDQARIRYAVCSPKSAPASRVIYIANGRTEWIEKYAFLPERLNLGPGYEFVFWDHRGQGASSGAKADIRSYDLFIDDMSALVAETAKNRPYSVIAHSMGALITLTTALRGKIQPQKLVLSAPLFLVPEDTMKRRYARTLSALISRSFLGKRSVSATAVDVDFSDNVLTHSAENYKIILSSQYRIPSPTFNWVYATFRATDIIYDEQLLKRLSCPVLLLAGTEETVVDPKGFELWCETVRKHSSAKIRHAVIDGARHEILFESEPYFSQAVDHIKKWLVEP